MTVEERLEKIRGVAQLCTNCILGKYRNKLVFGEGNPHANIMFVGEGPGRTENEFGRPFIGVSGKLLRGMIKDIIGLDPEKDCYITNVVKCRPPGNRAPLKDEMDHCIKFLKKQISVISPKLLVLLGRTSVLGLLDDKRTVTLSNLRKYSEDSLLFYKDVPVYVTFHPSAMLRKLIWREEGKVDFVNVKRYLDKLIY